MPDRQGELRLRAVAVDSGGHQVGSQVVILPLREDRAPTVAVAQPRPEARLTEGRDFALVVAAQDDVAIRSVEVLVEGGLAGHAAPGRLAPAVLLPRAAAAGLGGEDAAHRRPGPGLGRT